MKKLILFVLIMPCLASAQTYWTPGIPPGTTSTTLSTRYLGTDSLTNFYFGISNRWSQLYTATQVNGKFQPIEGVVPGGLFLSVSGTTASVTPGSWVINGVTYSKGTTTNITIPAADPTLSQYVDIYATTSNTILSVNGTASLTPVEPNLPDNTVVVGVILVQPTGPVIVPSTGHYVTTNGNNLNIRGKKGWKGFQTYSGGQQWLVLPKDTAGARRHLGLNASGAVVGDTVHYLKKYGVDTLYNTPVFRNGLSIANTDASLYGVYGATGFAYNGGFVYISNTGLISVPDYFKVIVNNNPILQIGGYGAGNGNSVLRQSIVVKPGDYTTDLADVSLAALDLRSSTQGFLIPRMTNAQRLAVISTGIYNTQGTQIYQTDGAEGIYLTKSTGAEKMLTTSDLPSTSGFEVTTNKVGTLDSSATHYPNTAAVKKVLTKYLPLPTVTDSTNNYRFDGYAPFQTTGSNVEGNWVDSTSAIKMYVWRHATEYQETSNTGVIWGAFYTVSTNSWGTPFVIYDSAYDDRNIVAAKAKDGSIVIAFRRYDAVGGVQIDYGYIRSTDGGATWSTYTAISTGVAEWPFGEMFNRGNKLYFVSYVHQGSGNATATLHESLDFGVTFPNTYTLYSTTSNFVEPYVKDLPDGTSIILVRNDSGTPTSPVYQYTSPDGFNFTLQGATNINVSATNTDDAPISYALDGNVLSVFSFQRLTTAVLGQDPRNSSMNIYVQDYRTVFGSPTSYALKHSILRPTPSDEIFRGYSRQILISPGHYKGVVSDAVKFDNSGITSGVANFKDQLSVFDYYYIPNGTNAVIGSTIYPKATVVKNPYNGGMDYVYTVEQQNGLSGTSNTVPKYNTDGKSLTNSLIKDNGTNGSYNLVSLAPVTRWQVDAKESTGLVYSFGFQNSTLTTRIWGMGVGPSGNNLIIHDIATNLDILALAKATGNATFSGTITATVAALATTPTDYIVYNAGLFQRRTIAQAKADLANTITLSGDVTGSGTTAITTAIKSSVALAGSPTTTTQTAGTNNTTIATTAFVATAIQAGTTLSTTTAINFASTANTLLYTNSTGKTILIDRANFVITAATSATIGPTVTLTVTSASDLMPSTALTGLTAVNKMFGYATTGISVVVPNGSTVTLGVTAGTATTLTGSVKLIGETL